MGGMKNPSCLIIGKILLISISGLLILTSCTDPKKTVIPADMSKWETDLKPSIEKLSEEDRALLTAYLMKAKLGEAFGGKPEEGLTIGKAIENEKAWTLEQEKKDQEAKLLKEKLQKEQAQLQKQVDDMLTVTVLKLKLEKESFRTIQVIKLGFKNNGSKDISGIKGTVRFIDMFGKEVGSIAFSFTDGLKSGGTAKWSGSRHYNEFISEHRAIANLEEGKYKSRFKPEMIVFKDGSKLALPEAD